MSIPQIREDIQKLQGAYGRDPLMTESHNEYLKQFLKIFKGLTDEIADLEARVTEIEPPLE